MQVSEENATSIYHFVVDVYHLCKDCCLVEEVERKVIRMIDRKKTRTIQKVTHYRHRKYSKENNQP